MLICDNFEQFIQDLFAAIIKFTQFETFLLMKGCWMVKENFKCRVFFIKLMLLLCFVTLIAFYNSQQDKESVIKVSSKVLLFYSITRETLESSTSSFLVDERSSYVLTFSVCRWLQLSAPTLLEKTSSKIVKSINVPSSSFFR